MNSYTTGILKKTALVKVSQVLLFLNIISIQITAIAEPTLVFNTTGQPPLNTKQDNGFMDEVTREALKRIGYKLKINRLPAERGLRNINNGDIDGEMSRIKGMEKKYKNLVRIPEKIMDWEFIAFSENNITLTNSWKSLDNKSIAFITGWKILENNVPKTAYITKARNAEQLFRLLKKGRTNYVLYEKWGGNLIIKNNNLPNITSLSPPLAVKEMYIYLHKKHIELVPKLSESLKELKNDGTYQALEKKHLKTYNKQ